MNGPTPIISSMLNSTADRSPIRRSSFADESGRLVNPPMPRPAAAGKFHPSLIFGGSVGLEPHESRTAKSRALAPDSTISTSCQILHACPSIPLRTRQHSQCQGTTSDVSRERQKKRGLQPLWDVRSSSHILCASSNRIPLTGLYTDHNHVLFPGSTSHTRHAALVVSISTVILALASAPQLAAQTAPSPCSCPHPSRTSSRFRCLKTAAKPSSSKRSSGSAPPPAS